MDAELEQFKGLNLSQYAASYGYQLDRCESSRNSAVMRHASGDKIIIARQGPHWVYFSVRDDTDHGTILDFVKHRDRCSLGAARQVLRQWSGSPPPVPPIHYAHKLEPITRDRAAVMDNGNDSSKILIHPANPLNDLQRRLLNPLENYPSNSLKMKYSKFPFSVFTKLQFGEQHSG